MTLPPAATPEGQAGLDALLADPRHALIAADFDGTLSPIVARPGEQDLGDVRMVPFKE